MESSLNPKTQFQSALQSRQQEQQRQAKFFKVAVPIALAFHGLAIGGLTMLAQRGIPEAAAEEVEIVVDNTTDQKDEPQPIDPNGQGGDLAGGGGGGGSNKFSLLQADGGASDGNHIAALGNPFTTPEALTEVTTPVPETSAETPATPETIPEESKKSEPEKPESKKLESTQPESIKTDSKVSSKAFKASSKMGELNGKAEGKGDKGDPNGGKLNPNAPTGAGKAGGTGDGSGPGNGSGTGTGNGSGNGSGRGTGNLGNPGQKPVEKLPSSNPAPTIESKPQPIAIDPQTQATPQKKSPKCISNCNLDGYLGAEGTVRISQEIDKNGNVTAKLVKSSGDPEIDRKALEAIQNRKYESSDDGYRSNIRVTSQQEGSEFQREQENRRRQEQGDRDAIARDRILQDQERQAREREARPDPVKPAEPNPVPIPPAPIAPAPVVPAPIAPEPIAPEPVVPAPIPAPEPIAPMPEPEPITAPEPIAQPSPAPVELAPVPEASPPPAATP